MFRRLLALLLGLLPCGGAVAADPPAQPFLRIEAGGHTSAVGHLAVDASGRLLATAGYDKTIRLWSLPDGVQRAVLRPPIGTLQEGEIYAVALTPDGRRVFAAGATGGQWDTTFSIYVFDVERGTLAMRLGNLPSQVNDLAMSPDGARFAAGLAQGGVRMWETASGKAIYEDRGYAGPVRSVVLDREGRLYSAAADGKLRVYDPTGRKLAEAAPPSGLRPWGIALSPDGGLLAVTSETADKTGRLHVDVVAARSLAAVFAPDTAGLEGDGLLAVGWSADGRGGVQLLAGGYAHSNAGGYVMRRWGDFGLGAFTDIAAARDTIRHILPLPGGGAAYATEDPGWGRLGPEGRVLRPPSPPLADLRPARERRLAVSSDGATVEFATGAGLQRFALRERSLAAAAKPDDKLAPPRGEAAGLALARARDSSAPTLNGQPIALNRDEIARSVAILPDASGLLLGTDIYLRRYARDGRLVAQIETPAAVWAVTVASGGKVAVAALLDGTLRWYGLEDGLQERAALFAHADGQRWVLFTPEGFFDHADRGGNELVGVHLNRARNQQPEWVSFSQAYRVLYAPAIVRSRLLGEPAAAQSRLAELGDIRTRLARQPLVEIKSACLPQPDRACEPVMLKSGVPVALPADATSIRLTTVVTERGLGVGPLDLFINERNAGRSTIPANATTVVLDAKLDPGANILQLRLYDGAGVIFTEAPPIVLTREGSVNPTERGRLFVLAIGIDHYANATLELNYAVADARSFAADIRAAAAPLYRSVEVTELIDAQATRAGIEAVFTRLAKEIRPTDTFLFYVASHGLLDETTNRFLLVPQDMSDISSWPAMARQAIDEATLVGLLSRIDARDALLFLDTCHAGQVTADSLANVGHETGRYMLAASSSVQEALDSFDDRNGVFVYALREALTGRAGEDADGNLGALSLGEYVSRRVGQLARQKGHEQDAVFRTAQRDLRSFPVARIRR